MISQKNVFVGLAAIWLFSEYMREKEVPPVHYVGSIPGGFNACCLPPFGIFITHAQVGNSRLLAHELEHWRQFREMGLMRFFSTYADEVRYYGYDMAPMEIAARIAAGEDQAAIFDYTAAVRTGKAKTVYNPYFRK